MTEENAKKSAATKPPTSGPDKAARTSNFAKAAGESGAGEKKTTRAGKGGGSKGGRRKGWLWLLLFIVLLAVAGSWAWYNWPPLRERLAGGLDLLPFQRTSESTGADVSDRGTQTTRQSTQSTPRQPEPAQTTPDVRRSSPPTTTSPATTPAEITALRNRLGQQQRTIAQLQQQVATLRREVTAQGSRLGELGNLSRDDWQLAEANYLLRLANQRLLLERDSRAALGLVEQVDEILQRVDLPGLYGVRQQLARDLTALKLVENVDREGLYLRLRALEEQLVRASIQPKFDLTAKDQATEPKTPENAQAASTWRRSWRNFTQFMSDSVRIRDSEIDPVLLSPQSEARFRQNLRLNMQQAELALLREDSTVYRDALNRALELLQQYGAPGEKRERLARELEKLRDQTIVTELPSLAASQKALHNYIERLHETSPPDTTTGSETPEGSRP